MANDHCRHCAQSVRYWKAAAIFIGGCHRLKILIIGGGLRGIPHQTARQRGLANLARFGLSAKANQPVRELSRGMQQIVAICCALIHQPKLLLLDEPTLGLDLPAVEKIQTIIRQLVAETQLGVLLTTHDMGMAQALADDLLMIDRGKNCISRAHRQCPGWIFARNLCLGIHNTAQSGGDQPAHCSGHPQSAGGNHAIDYVAKSRLSVTAARRAEPVAAHRHH